MATPPLSFTGTKVPDQSSEGVTINWNGGWGTVASYGRTCDWALDLQPAGELAAGGTSIIMSATWRIDVSADTDACSGTLFWSSCDATSKAEVSITFLEINNVAEQN